MKIYDEIFENPLILGTARYPAPADIIASIHASGAQLATLSLRRERAGNLQKTNSFFELVASTGIKLLPNTAGCLRAKDAVVVAHMSREVFGTPLIKLEVITDLHTLTPHTFETYEAARILSGEGFQVLPYITTDLALCEKLVDLGCQVLMPWAAPIGSGRGVLDKYALENLRKKFSDVTMIVDAGLGKPSHAAMCMEMGYDGVMVNTAVARAVNPPRMAEAFALAAKAGRQAYQSGLIKEESFAIPSTNLEQTPFWKD